MKWLSRCSSAGLFFVFLVGLTAVPKTAFSNGSPQSQPADTSQKTIQSLLSAPLPGKVAPEDAAAFYKPVSLYQYIDGGADAYLLYDFPVLLHQNFKSGSAAVTADVYDMGRRERCLWNLCSGTIAKVQISADDLDVWWAEWPSWPAYTSS